MNYAHTYINKKTDVDRVHRILERGCNLRGCGRTYAILMLMVGEAQLGGPKSDYLYIGENMRHSWNDVAHALAEIMIEEGHDIKVDRGTRKIIDKTTGCMFILGGPSSDMNWTRGYRFDKTYIDLMPHTYHTYQRELDELRYRSEEIYYG